MNVWLMKTNQDLHSPIFVGLDEEGIDADFGSLDAQQRCSLFTRLQQVGAASSQYGLVKQFFEAFYDLMAPGDVIVLGAGHRTQFKITALLRVTSPAYFVPGHVPRHRRDADLLWQGAPIPVQEWGLVRRLERLDSLQGFMELTEVLLKLMTAVPFRFVLKE